jgi:AraC-like DNA-binding protein
MTKILKTGRYLGISKKSINVNGIVITDTGYCSRDIFPPHCHENLYIAYVLRGNYIESNKRQTSRCLPGSVIFHKIHEKHSNKSFADNSSVLNIEIKNSWLEKYSISNENIENHIAENTVEFKHSVKKIHSEYLISDSFSHLGIETSVLKSLSDIIYRGSVLKHSTPEWVYKVKEMLHYEEPAKLNLSFISKAAGLHPVHVSRDFSRYFLCSMSEYVRRLKIEKAEVYLKSNCYSLAEITYKCGFADQSHFTREFKRIKGVTPNEYRKLILN